MSMGKKTLKLNFSAFYKFLSYTDPERLMESSGPSRAVVRFGFIDILKFDVSVH